MLLSKLVSDKSIVKDCIVDNVTHILQEVNRKSVFVCFYNGVKAEKEIEIAIKNGAALVVSTFYQNENVNYVVVEDIRCFYAKICSRIYGYDNCNVKVIGVVGTNGKTSIVKMLAHLLKSAGKKVGYFTTHKAYYANREIVTNMTTPDPPLLFSLIKNMADSGVEYVLMEVSAHAIFYKKCMPIQFEYLIYSNISQDHLDFFNTYENYKNVKKSIFFSGVAKNVIVNSDDSLGVEILQKINAVSYGLNNPADIFAINIKQEKTYTKFIINAFDDIKVVKLRAVGLFNVYNFLSCVGVCMQENIELSDIVVGANNMTNIEGRIEYLGRKKGDIYLDYAHTPIGLKNLLISLKKITTKKLYCLFGCGGNRDSGKRKLMGEIAGQFADFTIITSDNPRFEEPYEIIKQIESGIKTQTSNYIIVQDRSFAIKYAIDSLKTGDILVVAGKGDENYQEIMGVKHFFSDRKLIKSIIEK